MKPFAEFRAWLHDAPRFELTGTAIGAATVVAVLCWALLPTTTRAEGLGITSPASSTAAAARGARGEPGAGSSKVTAAGGTAQNASPPGSAGSTLGGSAVREPAPGAAAASMPTHPDHASSPARCVSPPGTAPGVTARQMRVAVIEVNIFGPAGNSTFDEPTTQQQHDWYQRVIDAINAAGGVACRRIVPTYYAANPADQSDLQQKCLDIVQSGAFAVLDVGAYGPFPQKDCYAQHHVPFFSGYIMTAAEQQQYYPYLFTSETFETLYRNTVFALRDRGFFKPGNGFRKLGFVYESCYPYLVNDMLGWLREAGVPGSQIVTYDMGCPAAFPTAADQQQAVLTFQRSGVTHVTTAGFVGGFPGFTQAAQQQNFHPKYGIPDDYLVPLSYGPQHPDYSNIAGAIAITANRNGEERTPGMRPSPGTSKCNAILTAGGGPPVYEQGSGMGGIICSELWVFKAAVEHAPVISREALAAGLQAARSVELSFPDGPNNLSGHRSTVWMNYWRVDEFFGGCRCWRVVDRTFHPSYR